MSIGLLSRNQLQDLESLLRRIPGGYDGAFVDPFDVPGDDSERSSWTTHESALFLSWWAFCPPYCKVCGSAGRWYPSLDEEYRCHHCSTGAGSTKTNELVEDIPTTAEEDWQDVDDDDEDLAHDSGLPDIGFLPATEGFITICRQLEALSSDVVLESHRLPSILRVAINILHLTLLPDLEEPAEAVTRATALFLACCTEAMYSVPFPLFQRASGCDILWCDVEAMATEIGIPSDTLSFFADIDRAIQNFMAIIDEDDRPPGITWSLYRVPGQLQHVQSLPSLQKEAFSPDHTAAAVVMELLRQFESDHRSRQDYERLTIWIANQRKKRDSRCLYLLPDTIAASLFLCVVSEAFHITQMSLAELVERIGFYQGEIAFKQRLRTLLANGDYAMPLTRRVRAYVSPWTVVYRALQSEDRLILLQLLFLLSASPHSVRELQGATKCVQSILRKHGSVQSILFYYCFRVPDAEGMEEGKLMKGVYFCSSIRDDRVNYSSFNGKRAITFISSTRKIILEGAGIPTPKVVDSIPIKFMPPSIAHVESFTSKLLLDCCCSGLHADKWNDAVSRIEARLALRRRMLSVSDDELAEVLRTSKPFRQSSSNDSDNSITSFKPITMESIAESFRLFCRTVDPSLVHCLGDSEAIRRHVELAYLQEAGHPSVHITGDSPIPQAFSRKKPRADHTTKDDAPTTKKRRTLLDSGQVVRRVLKAAVIKLAQNE